MSSISLSTALPARAAAAHRRWSDCDDRAAAISGRTAGYCSHRRCSAASCRGSRSTAARRRSRAAAAFARAFVAAPPRHPRRADARLLAVLALREKCLRTSRSSRRTQIQCGKHHRPNVSCMRRIQARPCVAASSPLRCARFTNPKHSTGSFTQMLRIRENIIGRRVDGRRGRWFYRRIDGANRSSMNQASPRKGSVMNYQARSSIRHRGLSLHLADDDLVWRRQRHTGRSSRQSAVPR